MPFMLLYSLSASEQPADVKLVIPYEKQALANSMRCLETSDGDYERIAKLRNWVAENLAYFGDEIAAISTLRSTKSHYHVPFGCVDTAMTFLGHGQRHAVAELLSMALDVLPYAVGHSPELVQYQILRLATVTEDTNAIKRTWEAEILTGSNLYRPYQSFLQVWRPNLWDMIQDRLFASRPWEALKKNPTRDEEIEWKKKRSSDYFTSSLFLREAQNRVRSKKTYPSSWIQYVEGGVSSPTISTRPAALSAELAELALLEGKPSLALLIVGQTWKLLSDWAPEMTGIYRIERDLALILSAIPDAQNLQVEARDRISKRSENLIKHLDPYEQLVHLPLLAESFHALGAKAEAQTKWKLCADLCAQNQNPESQSAGLTRIWMSYARANAWPTKETEALLQKIEKKLPAAYSKINF
jgi:hypothetical protein